VSWSAFRSLMRVSSQQLYAGEGEFKSKSGSPLACR
jgi:hypothetical protein